MICGWRGRRRNIGQAGSGTCELLCLPQHLQHTWHATGGRRGGRPHRAQCPCARGRPHGSGYLPRSAHLLAKVHSLCAGVRDLSHHHLSPPLFWAPCLRRTLLTHSYAGVQRSWAPPKTRSDCVFWVCGCGLGVRGCFGRPHLLIQGVWLQYAAWLHSLSVVSGRPWLAVWSPSGLAGEWL